jgi:hypothetical protein
VLVPAVENRQQQVREDPQHAQRAHPNPWLSMRTAYVRVSSQAGPINATELQVWPGLPGLSSNPWDHTEGTGPASRRYRASAITGK